VLAYTIQSEKWYLAPVALISITGDPGCGRGGGRPDSSWGAIFE
jgi:hypothetical protein